MPECPAHLYGKGNIYPLSDNEVALLFSGMKPDLMSAPDKLGTDEVFGISAVIFRNPERCMGKYSIVDAVDLPAA
jgi:hypothetical protein